MSADLQFCTFLVGPILFGVQVEKVQEVVRYLPMTVVPKTPPEVAGLMNLRGEIVPAIDLSRRLELEEAVHVPQHKKTNVVLLSARGKVSLLVDEVSDVITVPADSFQEAPETLRGRARELVAGVHTLAYQIMLVLETEAAVDLHRFA